MITRRTFVKGMAVTPVAGAALLRVPNVLAADAVKVGSKNFPEALIIGEMYAQLLEAAGMKVDRKLNLGGTAVAQAALKKGDIDLYPEYTGTALTAILGKSLKDVSVGTPSAASPGAASPAASASDQLSNAVYEYVKAQYKEQFNLVWLDQAPMNNSQALAVKKDFADKNHLITISQLWELAKSTDITISAPSDFEDRPDGLAGLKEVYGDVDVKVKAVDPGIKYKSFLNGDANVVLAFTTDAEIGQNNLVVLEDDKHLWPPYHVAPVVRQDALDANPKLAPALNALAPVLTTDAMIKMNGEATGSEKREPADIAKDFLTQQGLLK